MIRNYCTYDKHMLRPVCRGNNSVVSCKKCGAVYKRDCDAQGRVTLQHIDGRGIRDIQCGVKIDGDILGLPGPFVMEPTKLTGRNACDACPLDPLPPMSGQHPCGVACDYWERQDGQNAIPVLV